MLLSQPAPAPSPRTLLAPSAMRFGVWGLNLFPLLTSGFSIYHAVESERESERERERECEKESERESAQKKSERERQPDRRQRGGGTIAQIAPCSICHAVERERERQPHRRHTAIRAACAVYVRSTTLHLPSTTSCTPSHGQPTPRRAPRKASPLDF